MKKSKLFFLFILFIALSQVVNAQYTLVKPNGYLEVSGYLVSFYNQQFYDKGTTDKHKNRFALDYAVFRLDGSVNKRWNYQLQLNNAALFDPATSDGFLMDAYVAYNSLRDNVEVKFGYSKIPFSRSSLVSNTESPYIQRPEATRGTFTRRDLGTTIKYSLFNKKVTLYAGAYTGLGSQSLLGDNDASGNLEYAGRIEFSYPVRYRRVEVDLNHIHVPLIALGVDGRYANKKTDFGTNYPYEILNGKKISYGANADFVYNGLSVHGEYLNMNMTPNDTTLLLGKPTNHFNAGGYVLGANYCFKKYKTILAARYDTYNPNDLIKGDTETSLSVAADYLIDGLRSCIKVQYWKRFKDKDASKVFTRDQLRIGYQLQF